MLGRCLITTSRACMASNGICCNRPSSASSRLYRLTWATHLMPTLNTLSLPSPGRVTSRSTYSNTTQQKNPQWDPTLYLNQSPICFVVYAGKSGESCHNFYYLLLQKMTMYFLRLTWILSTWLETTTINVVWIFFLSESNFSMQLFDLIIWSRYQSNEYKKSY